MDDLAWEFGCRLGSLPTTYLGMPLGALLSQLQFGMVWKSTSEEAQSTEIRENPKGLPLGWGQFGAKASFSKMGVGVFKEALWNQVIREKYGEDRRGLVLSRSERGSCYGVVERNKDGWKCPRLVSLHERLREAKLNLGYGPEKRTSIGK
ncbi:hypothetical protein CK203_011249 [Vitis vinifera]|uniref:Uncharacterized protein n=1 Tax=Vitis vinifera TaxID=29760 RepID=A0A438JYI6_VITVI|nr:hypothetical protein CK203_011249 [Vitis vinifera]